MYKLKIHLIEGHVVMPVLYHYTARTITRHDFSPNTLRLCVVAFKDNNPHIRSQQEAHIFHKGNSKGVWGVPNSIAKSTVCSQHLVTIRTRIVA